MHEPIPMTGQVKMILSVLLIALATSLASAEPNLPELRDYRVYCDPDSFQYILDNAHEDHYIACEFVYQDDVWHDARLRIRGDSSRDYPKKSFKINFDRDERFAGRDKINLNGEWTDPTFSREYLSYDYFRRSGLPTSHAWFAKLYVNDEYLGLYVDAEQVDEHLLQRLAIDDDASIYKATYDGAMLRAEENVDSLWEKKTNVESGFYDLHNLVAWLATVSDSEFYEQLGQTFNRELLARHMAVNTLIGNESTYYHNYYLIHDLKPGGRWSILPWDMDRTLLFWGYRQSVPEYHRSSKRGIVDANALIERCWRDSAMRADVYRHAGQMADSLSTYDYYTPLIEHLDTLLVQAVESDPNRREPMTEFHEPLLDLPEKIVERGNYMSLVATDGARPFSVHGMAREPDSLRFSWEPSSLPDGEPPEYRFLLADEPRFRSPTSYSVGTDTLFRLAQPDTGTWYWRPEALGHDGVWVRGLQLYRSFVIVESEPQTLPEQIDGEHTVDAATSPALVSGSVRIQAGATLTCSPGSVLLFDDGAELIVEGELSLAGEAGDSVHVAPSTNGIEPVGITVRAGGSVSLNRACVDGADSPLTLTVLAGGELNVQHGQFVSVSRPSIVVDGADATIVNSLLTGTDSPVLVQQAGQVSIQNSRLFSQDDDPSTTLVEQHGGSLTIRQCEIRGDAGTLLLTKNMTSRLTLAKSTITGGTVGLSAQDGVELDLALTTFEGCGTALRIGTGVTGEFFNGVVAHCDTTVSSGSSTDDDTESVVVRNVVFALNDAGMTASPNPANIAYSYSDDPEATWIGLVSGDIGVTDAWNGNWQVLQGSPLIDAGWGTDIPTVDVRGQQRVDTPSAPNTGAGRIDYADIGLYEYAEGSVPGAPPPDPDYLIAWPNPASGTVRLEFDLLEDGWAELEVHNVLGKLVYRGGRQTFSAGRCQLIWRGLNQAGTEVASGMYFCTLRQSGMERTLRIIMLR